MVAGILTGMSGMFLPGGLGNGDGGDYTRTPPPLQKIVDWFHGRASTNRREDIHHTLGYGPGQAAPGEDVRAFFLGQGVPGYGENIGGSTPPGTVIDGFWTSAPSGYLMLDGSVVSRSQYPALFSILGTTYNTGGETSAEFRLPDARGRVLVQLDTTAEFNALGKAGGAKTHLLTAAQSGLRAHTHTPNSTGQYVLANGSGGPGGTANVTTGGGGYVQTTLNNAAAQNATEAHNNVQPSAVGVWCVVAASTIGEYDPIVQAALVAQVATLQGGSVQATLAAGWTHEPDNPVTLHKRGNMVTIQGGAVRDNWPAYTASVNIPAGYRPPGYTPLTGMTRSSGSMLMAYFEPATNQVNIQTAGGAGTTGIRFATTWFSDR